MLNWPIPPYFEQPAGGEPWLREDCEIEMQSGYRLQGRLQSFSPKALELVLESVPAGTEKRVVIRQVRCIRFQQGVNLVPLPVPAEISATKLQAHLVAEQRPFVIRYRDGMVQAGDTKGYLHDRHGSYLYVPGGQAGHAPWFVPITAGSVQLGMPLAASLGGSDAGRAKSIAAAETEHANRQTRPVGQYLIERGLVTPAQVEEALGHQSARPGLRLGETLVREGTVSPEDLRRALQRQRENRGKPLADVLVEMGLVEREPLTRAMAEQLGIPFVDVGKFAIDKDALSLVTPAFAYLHRIIPLYRSGPVLAVAAERPLDQDFINELRFATELQVVPVLALGSDILARLKAEYGVAEAESGSTGRMNDADGVQGGRGESLEDLLARVSEEAAAGNIVEKIEPGDAADNSLVRLVNRMILDAYSQGASDIHIETNPGARQTLVRLRKDGTLVDFLELPAQFHSAVVSRIKIMCGLDISEHRRPQDGKISFEQFGGVKLDLRVAVLPTSGGMEDIVLRLLSAAKPMSIDGLGLSTANLATIKRLAQRSYGLILVCGPTGSGKTTTLHSVLGFINTPELKIWTAEDPIEITHFGLRQMQVNPKIGLSFAAAMRSFLRADPDVIMVGEMRDQETVKIGIEASLTGHLVFSTLHTNSAVESVVRLLDLGMDPFNFADALLGVLSQRLARRLCAKCRTSTPADHAELSELAREYCLESELQPEAVVEEWLDQFGGANRSISLSRPAGCDACHGSGYRGRLGVHEVLATTPAIKQLIQRRAPVSELWKAALQDGMKTLRQDGVEKILQGHTDLAQVRSACN